MRTKTPFRRVIRFLPMIAVMIIIFIFSCMEGDASSNTSEMLLKAIAKLFDEVSHTGLSGNALANLHLIIRKIAHFMEYLALGLTIMYAIYYFWNKHKASLILPEVIAVLYAASDEFHQYFVAGRYGTWTDVVIDSCGALTGILIYYAAWKHLQINKIERLSKKSAKKLAKKAGKRNIKENLLL